MGAVDVLFTVTVTVTPHIDVWRGKARTAPHDVGPRLLPYIVKMDPCAIPDADKPGARLLAAFTTPVMAGAGALAALKIIGMSSKSAKRRSMTPPGRSIRNTGPVGLRNLRP